MDTEGRAPRSMGERLRQELECCRQILDRQYEAIMAGKLDSMRELGQRESQCVLRIEALERALAAAADRGGASGGTNGAAVEALRAEVLVRNRRNRELLGRELLDLRRRITRRRIRLGTPSVYAQTGKATLIDVTT